MVLSGDEWGVYRIIFGLDFTKGVLYNKYNTPFVIFKIFIATTKGEKYACAKQ